MGVNVYATGITVRLSAEFDDGAGVPADPTTITLRVRAPSGELESYSYAQGEIAKDAAGKYHKDVAVTEGGHWHYRWEGAGAIEAVGEGRFYGELSRAAN